MTTIRMNRRQFFETLGKSSLVVGFSLAPVAASILGGKAHAASADATLTITTGPLTGAASPPTDAWITIDHQGNITLFSGKVELGTGTQTAFSQIVAEELYVDVSAITYVQGDTSQTPDQGTTAGSKSIQVQGPLVRRAAATAFQQLLQLAQAYLGSSDVMAQGGSFGIGSAMKHPTTYAKLISGLTPQQRSINSNSSAPLKDYQSYTVVGQPVPRVDLFDKFTGKFTYVSDVVVPGMLHGRVVRNNFSGAVATSKPKNATFMSLDDSAARAVPGFVQTVQNQNFVGVVATTEWAAILAARGVHVSWQNGDPLASSSDPTSLQAAMKNQVYASTTQEVVGDATSAFNTAPIKLADREYFSPYNMHGSVGPCCAVANVTAAPDPATGIQATVWSGTQGVYPLQTAVADVLGIAPTAVRIIYAEGAGCYGHNGADDVAVDAALLSQAAKAPVRVQWMRQDEHGWEPLGPAIAHTLNGALDSNGKVVSWSHEMWSPPHSSRPGGGGSLLAGQEINLFPPPLSTKPVNQGTRNAPVNYDFPNMTLSAHHVRPYKTSPANSGAAALPLVNTFPRSSALRSLGGMSNCFANESFMDELARTALKDPIDFRKQYVCALSGGSGSATSTPVHGGDARAADALTKMATQAAWGSPLAQATKGTVAGKGVAFARYETVETYVAVYAEVEVATADTAFLKKGEVWVRRVVVAHDCGLIINPDGLKNQIEGNVIQGISRTLIEEVGFNTSGITSLLWASANPAAPPATIYPVIHFNQVPTSIEIVLIDHPEQITQSPDQPAWGAGEPTIGPVAPAIANAIFDAIGKRMMVLPITKARVVAALAGP